MDYIYSGNKIRKLRKLKGYTIEKLAEEADISTKFLYEIEKGKTGFSVNVLYKLSKILNVSCDYILMNDKQETSDLIIELSKNLNDREKAAVENILFEIIKLRETVQ